MGCFADDVIHGLGSVFQNGKKVFEGEFEKGLKHGPGKFSFSNGNYFLGYFNKDHKRGLGKLVINQPNWDLREVKADFGPNEQVQLLSVTLAENEDRNLNTVALQKNSLKRNHLIERTPLWWCNQQEMSNKQVKQMRELEKFDQRTRNCLPKEDARSEEFGSEETYSNSDSEIHSGIHSDSDKGDSTDACGNFECSRTNWPAKALESLRFGRQEPFANGQSESFARDILKRKDAEDFLISGRGGNSTFEVNESFESLFKQMGLEEIAKHGAQSQFKVE